MDHRQESAAVMNVTDVDLADSALHAPAAGFGDEGFYPYFVDKAAVLVVRLARNHPLPDGNKRAAWVSLRLLIDINDWTWEPQPLIDDAQAAVLAVASLVPDLQPVGAGLARDGADGFVQLWPAISTRR
jgi:death-on-curing protein